MDPSPTSYSLGAGVYGISIGVEAGHSYTVGDAESPADVPTFPAAAAVTVAGGSIQAAYQRWRAGIIFTTNSLYRGSDGLDGNATAIQMAQGHQVEWKASNTVAGARIRSDVTSVANADVGIVFANSKIDLVATSSEAKLFEAEHATNGVNYLKVKDQPAGSFPILSSEGADTQRGISILANDIGQVRFASHGAVANINLSIVPPASAPVNFMTITGGATGNPVTAGASGADTSIDYRITPKGSGLLRYGTHTAIAAETVTGYITIKDSGGTTRKLAVVS